MKMVILGSGATQTIPRPCCNCRVCVEARKKGVPYSRGGPSLFIYDENILIDTPPDIANLLNRENIQNVSYVFYTHWHPDHTSGSLLFEQINWDWIKMSPKNNIYVHFPEGVHEDLQKYKLSGIIDYANIRKIIEIKKISDEIKIGKLSIKPIKVDKNQNFYGFLIEENGKKVFYAPCDIMGLNPEDIKNVDLAIVECGRLEHTDTEPDLTIFRDVLEKLKIANVKQKIITHIEENRQISYSDSKKLEKKYNVKFAYDRMTIEI